MPQNIIDIDPLQSLDAAVRQLQLPKQPLIILLGAFPDDLKEQVRSVCHRVVAPIALEPGAIVLDDAKCSGCAAAFADAAAAEDRTPTVVGVISHDRPVTEVDPTHERILRLPAGWTDVAKYTFQIADALVNDPAVSDRVVAMLFGGTDEDKQAVIRCARRQWPVIVLKSSGGLADQLIKAITPLPDGSQPPLPADPDLREIIENTTIYRSSLDATTEDLQHQVRARVDPQETAADTLKEAWARFDELDWAALVRQRWFRLIEIFFILLGVFAALVAILTTIPFFVDPNHRKQSQALHWLVIVTPIAISIIGAYNSHFRDGNKWILLRGAAEGLKREIFRFRTKAGAYSDEQCQQVSREMKLASRVKDVTSALEQSEVNKNNLEAPKSTPDPKRNEFISPEEYIKERVQDQAKYFVKKTRQLFLQLRVMQFGIYVVGGIGTYLAAVHWDVWVALATAVVTAIATKLQADQVESTLAQYNQTLSSLRNIECWWKALSRWEKSRRKNIDLLVDQTERTMETETAGWVQQMQSALEKLTEKEPQNKTS